MAQSEFLIVGLGNPGRQYSDTRHNVGFLVLDELARRWGASLTTEKWQAFSGRLNRGTVRLTLIKPTTYMNLSGQAVVEFVHFYKAEPKYLVVIHDDLDMPPGRLKLVYGGGAGGHNGIKSISQHLGDTSFYRLKIGIGRPGKGEVHPDMAVSDYVLSRFTNEEHDDLGKRYDILVEGLHALIDGNPAKAMNIINSCK